MMSGIRIPVVALAVTASAMAAFSSAMSRTGATIEKSITTAVDLRSAALAARDGLAEFDPAHLHLSSQPSHPAGHPRFSIGDRFSLSERGGSAQTYAIVDVRPLTAKQGEVGGELARLAIVTAARVDQPSQTLRFIVETEAPLLVPVSKPRTL